MQEIAAYAALVSSAVSLAGFAGILIKRSASAAISRRQAEDAYHKAEAVEKKCERLQELLADYRASNAADVAIVKTLAESNMSSLAAAEGRLSTSIDRLTDRFDRFDKRMDEWGDRRRE